MKRILSILTVLLLFAQITQAGEHAPGAATSPPVSHTVCPPNAQICTLAGSGTKTEPTPTPAPLTPLQAAIAKLTADSVAWEASNGSLSAAQAVVANLTPSVATLAQQVAADQAEIANLVKVNPPGPGPTPVTHTVSLLAITSTATCAPCRQLAPVLTALAAKGIPVAYLDGADGSVLTKWKADSIPTVITLIDGVEPNNGTAPDNTRAVGVRLQASYEKWVADWREWAKKGGGK